MPVDSEFHASLPRFAAGGPVITSVGLSGPSPSQRHPLSPWPGGLCRSAVPVVGTSLAGTPSESARCSHSRAAMERRRPVLPCLKAGVSWPKKDEPQRARRQKRGVRPRVVRLDAAYWGLRLIQWIYATLGAVAIVPWTPSARR